MLGINNILDDMSFLEERRVSLSTFVVDEEECRLWQGQLQDKLGDSPNILVN